MLGSRNEKKAKENALGYPAAHQASLASSPSFYLPQRDPGTSSIRSGQLASGLCERDAAFRGPIDYFLERNASARSRQKFIKKFAFPTVGFLLARTLHSVDIIGSFLFVYCIFSRLVLSVRFLI